jgi:hypothetical protein
MREASFSSKAYGTHEYKDLTVEGRVQFDLLMALQVGAVVVVGVGGCDVVVRESV